MITRHRWLRPLLRLAVISAVLLLAACGTEQSALDPRGPDSASLAGLWWFIFWLGTAVFVLVMALAAVPAWRSWRAWRADGRATHADVGALPPEGMRGEVGYQAADEERHEKVLVWGVGAGMSAVILVVLMIVSAPIGPLTAPMRPPAENPVQQVEVTAHMFWWEVRYPEEGLVTANEIHIPAGEEVQLLLTSEDVIHSFWVPQLAGKIDMTPGEQTSIILEADEPGRYRGQCAEYCGMSHALMALHVVAHGRDDFEAWVEQQLEDVPLPDDPRIQEGQQIFAGSACVYCHTVRGHFPPSDIGPDLTHLMSREWIAAGRLPNNRGNLGGWILDPQSLKPGNRMPGTNMDGESLELLLDYLESLDPDRDAGDGGG